MEEEYVQGRTQNYGDRFRRGFGKRITGTSPAVGYTASHTPLLIVKLYITKEEVEAVVDTKPSASAGGKHLVGKFGMWKRARNVNVRQGDGGFWEGNYILNSWFKLKNFFLVLGKFAMDVGGLNIGHSNVLFRLS